MSTSTRFATVAHERSDSPSRDHLVGVLTDLFRREMRERPGNEYLIAHAQPNSILRQIDAFEAYRPYVSLGDRMLDWGCCHAPDSVLVREAFGSAVELYGCDFDPAGCFPEFHEHAGLAYRQLTDITGLPYDTGQFDVVVGSGVLEHAAMDMESLKELHRILRDDGLLILTFLPNRLSYTEFLSRRLGKPAHRRLYSRTEAVRLLRHFGFDPLRVRYHQFIPGQRLQAVFGKLWGINRVLERLWPTAPLCANIALIARKRRMM